MKIRKEYETTNNLGVYNKARKEILEREGKIHCSYCKYHDNENNTNGWYGGYETFGYRKLPSGKKDYSERVEYIDIRYPNWKLISKNKKQWMKNNLKREDQRLIIGVGPYYRFSFIW
jgi:hypothetical protein